MRYLAMRVSVAALAAAYPFVAAAEEKAPKRPWKNKTELSYVVTAGNSESSTFGFKNDFERKWDKNTLGVKLGGVRVETTRFSRTATVVGSTIVFDENPSKETTAESYFLAGRFERAVAKTFFWYGAAGWDRNRFAGIANRYIGEAGAGNTWFDRDEAKWKTFYAATWTDQEDVATDPATGAPLSDTFVGVRVGSDYFRQLTESTEYQNVTILDYNFDESDDWRGDMTNSLAVAMNTRLAIKVSLRWLYDNRPSFVAVPLTGGTTPTALFELDKLDTVFTASLVINF